jgi:hypothetical protein
VAGSAVMVALLGAGPALGQSEGCVLEDGRLPAGCRQANEGTVITRPVQPNVSGPEAPVDLGEHGFSISIDGVATDIGPGPRRTIAGAAATSEQLRDIDRLLEHMGVQLTYDGLGARPRLAVATADLRDSYAPGDTVTFRAASNYPGWIARAEVIVRDGRGDILAQVPIDPNGTADWLMPAAGVLGDAGTGTAEELQYTLRVHDSAGRRDETRAQRLSRSATPVTPDLTGPVYAAAEGEDMTAQRGIPVRDGAITVSGQAVGAAQAVMVMGERAPVDGAGRFVMQRILPPGVHGVSIGVDGRQTVRQVTVEHSEWFRTGIIDLTVGRDRALGETWRLGRIAGFAQGTLADGTRITASVDTREEELRDLFRNLGRKNPDQTLRQLDGRDVFNTFGDDSHRSELAPTSGNLYLRVERDGSHVTWGDFRPAEETSALVRSDRTLYGLSGEYRAPVVTSEGEPRLRVSGFASQADSLMQRDVLRATGGTAYFLSRQDILRDTATVMVEIRSRTSGLVIESRRLAEGTDYRINPVQGVVILNAPLSPSAPGGGLVADNPLGDHDVDLVVQYEYVPTTGNVDGYTVGLRAEGWLGDHLRVGASGLRETTGIADNTLVGADILLRQGESRELLLEYGVSEGVGFGSSFSLNAGMEILPDLPSAGLPGLRAQSMGLRGRTDLAMFGLDGRIEGYFDRKDEGFTAPGHDIRADQTAWGLSGEVQLTTATALTFGTEHFRDADGKREERARVGLAYELTRQWLVETELMHDERSTTVAGGETGARTDAAARLTWTRDEDLSVWGFGQVTLARDGTRRENHRLGFGVQTRLGERSDVLAEVSAGSLGGAGRLIFGYQRNETTRYTLGYTLDPMRRLDTTGFSGRDRGRLVLGATSRVNDRWSYTAENSYSAFGTRPSLTSGYGVSYTSDARWRYDGMLQFGRAVQEDGSTLERQGLSLGLRYTDGEQFSVGLRGEVRNETSDHPTADRNRRTWLVAGHYEQQTSEDWRFVSSLDAVVSNSDQSSFRDGRYVEARLGYAYRPAINDRLNALVSYSYLYDMPGADQVNIDGDREGPRQRSHIVNAALSYQLDPQWTLGAKYGLRFREQAARDSDVFTSSVAHLGVLRADYHIVHNWDIMAELRAMRFPRADVTEYGAVVGIYRHVGNELRLGMGYSWGRVSDDLRSVRAPREGLFLNLTAQF